LDYLILLSTLIMQVHGLLMTAAADCKGDKNDKVSNNKQQRVSNQMPHFKGDGLYTCTFHTYNANCKVSLTAY